MTLKKQELRVFLNFFLDETKINIRHPMSNIMIL